MRAAGGDVSVSFGGYDGTRLGQMRGSAGLPLGIRAPSAGNSMIVVLFMLY
jgi:hypothetical protein